MFKVLIIICLIIKIHSWSWNKPAGWTWENYPSPRGPDYWRCRVSKPTWVCDPDGMLTYQEREEIVELVEDFKEKTKRPNSTNPCMREGLRLVVALANVKIGTGCFDSKCTQTKLCHNDRKWTSTDEQSCDVVVQGIELNKDGFLYCRLVYSTMFIREDEFFWLAAENTNRINNAEYFDVLKDYINNLRMLYIHRFSIFDNPDASDNITLSEVHHSLQEGNTKLSEMQQSLDERNKTLFGLSEAVEENKLKLSEMRELLSQSEKLTAKKLTLSLKFCLDAQQSSIKKFEIRLIICCLFIALMLLYLSYRIHQVEKAKNVNFKPTASKPKLQSKAGNRRVTPMQYAKFIENKGK